MSADKRPPYYFLHKLRGKTYWKRTRIALGSAVMGRKAWRLIYRNILETCERRPDVVTRYLDEWYAAESPEPQAIEEP